ncbi:hypothetical protein CLU79DRAFT_864000 [Phycomyces nitens]|nr:hypothetical protein CLU79DRAFT_864000 [Phycomyces nitens]
MSTKIIIMIGSMECLYKESKGRILLVLEVRCPDLVIIGQSIFTNRMFLTSPPSQGPSYRSWLLSLIFLNFGQCVLQILHGFPGTFFGAIAFPVNKVLYLSVMCPFVQDRFDFILIFIIDYNWR